MKRNTKKQLRVSIVEGANAGDTLLREMWRLRLDFLNLTIPEAEDWRKFSGFCTRPNTLLINFFDEAGGLQGYFTFSFNPVEHENRKALLIHSKYYYVRPAYRGHSKITSAAWRLLPGIFRRFGLRRIYFVAFSFPTSFVSLSRTFGRVLTVQDEQTPAWEKTILENFARSLTNQDWDEQRKLIVNQNVPIGEDRPVTPSVQQLHSQYLSINPDWMSGISLPIMMKFDWATIKSVLHTSLRRSRRH